MKNEEPEMKTEIKHVSGSILPYRGNDVDTDRILPARYMKSLTFSQIEDHVFEDERRAFASESKVHPFDDSRYSNAKILVVNANFGCGSSREHAPQGLYRRGIRAIVGESFGEIFAGNCTSIGLPVVRVKPDEIASIQALADRNADASVELDLVERILKTTSGKMNVQIDDATRKQFIEGRWDALVDMLAAKESIRKTVFRLPYMSMITRPSAAPD